jgi:hypothetical protein
MATPHNSTAVDNTALALVERGLCERGAVVAEREAFARSQLIDAAEIRTRAKVEISRQAELCKTNARLIETLECKVGAAERETKELGDKYAHEVKSLNYKHANATAGHALEVSQLTQNNLNLTKELDIVRKCLIDQQATCASYKRVATDSTNRRGVENDRVDPDQMQRQLVSNVIDQLNSFG